ncbi:RNA polymerase, sigma 54 subunit, RpoN/SigL [Gulbenkiania indica]|uniref:RNA polymerase sigma-54 factor n=1 Tax=Gulbenkiania indica TaxID=375574 RepID=A0A0K6H288_9NEIS|nr:RNA polymerase factor sigma-54 [Gulbenkiania indica]CUA85015.1 RNA polymerase, sigma 54 subunit, RpoN/SigL [Gulbenkiania indica]
MKQSLQLKVSQQLTLTPQLQQSIRLLQLSTLDLFSEVERFLQDNPLLERQDDGPTEQGTDVAASTEAEAPAGDTSREDGDSGDSLAGELADWGHGSRRRDDGDDEYDPLLSVAMPVTLRDHLLAQLREVALCPRDAAVVQLLVEELDDAGYLPVSLEELSANLPAELELEADELAVGLALLQQFDPAGVGARTLSEALQLQLQRLPEHVPGRALALRLVTEALDLLGNRDFTRIKRQFGVDDDALKTAQKLVASLNPRPAAGYGADDTHYVIPDVVVRKRKGRWQADLNSQALPRLRVNQMYAAMLSRERQATGGEMSARLQEARWLVKNIQQRFDTILKVAEAIVDRQQAFFDKGEVAMRPLILRDIADELGLHESTISRVTTQKYLLCPRGLFELKYFFGSAVETDSGGECSATSIKAQIRQLIENEDSKRPLSDGALADLLGKQGIQVARRTVAKYREAMQIPPVSLRKVL